MNMNKDTDGSDDNGGECNKILLYATENAVRTG